MVKIPVKVVTWEEVVEWSTKLGDSIKEEGYQPDIIIAIARGGLVPARIVADVLGVLDMLSIKVEHWVETASQTPEAKVKYPYKLDLKGKRVLLVDDIADTGDSVVLAKKFVEDNFLPREVKTATMQYIQSVSKYKPDYVGMVVTEWKWFMYPWNYWEDEINLVRKILSNGGSDVKDIERKFEESYGIVPPIPLIKIMDEMKRRKMI
ncbi:phosphoribosyltransferase [Sulfolobus acidocaldarius]|uniref:Purine phosphoribosyltransferase n=4 Tax=Sulfolobus acidocaldarius TaxID=2285 RepID=Q4JA22_SULAC|nr:phosphoribosyltransferase [Sulfolobus acidocaldarius]AAY80358.1 purine phosphoribosyltransferase [Sulfolobus acidocaldarius DSM 639]AGE70939.1 purine phosphoribosyltransferase [Sulfolobus acidocaldarius N8]AGE73210.1 purine phosphoribosyltransferase [Sulfolobus acidocaldarius Ron12/I]ALU28755.1 phosphoribosyltransferase [Sulfolobus acidocaldarius]ALU31475.1 phosphoribosyltransferase [Sulfolobus acidocaldarius]